MNLYKFYTVNSLHEFWPFQLSLNIKLNCSTLIQYRLRNVILYLIRWFWKFYCIYIKSYTFHFLTLQAQQRGLSWEGESPRRRPCKWQTWFRASSTRRSTRKARVARKRRVHNIYFVNLIFAGLNDPLRYFTWAIYSKQAIVKTKSYLILYFQLPYTDSLQQMNKIV